MEEIEFRIIFNGMPTDSGKEALGSILWDCYHGGDGYTCGEVTFDNKDEAYKIFYKLSQIVINPDYMTTGDLELLGRDENDNAYKLRDVAFWRRD